MVWTWWKKSKYFFHLEKGNHNKSHITHLKTTPNSTVDDPQDILDEIKNYYSKLYSSSQTNFINPKFFDSGSFQSLSSEKRDTCEGMLTEEEVWIAIKSIPNNKTPGSDGISAEFYKMF